MKNRPQQDLNHVCQSGQMSGRFRITVPIMDRQTALPLLFYLSALSLFPWA
jgi:hypothetical protein